MSASTLKAGEERAIQFTIDQTALLAGTAEDIVTPFDGYIQDVRVAIDTAVTTGGTLTVAAGVTPTAVLGAVITVPNSAAKGGVYSASATEGSATRKVNKGDRIRITPASFATAGAVNGVVVIATADRSPQFGL